MSRRCIIALTENKVDLSLFPVATVENSISSLPPPLSQVILPRFVQHVRENFPSFDVIPCCCIMDFKDKEEELNMAEIIFMIDAPPSLLSHLLPMAKNIKWIHSYLAGVDGLCNELRGLYRQVPIPPTLLVTNNKGVFSSSLKEYTIAAIMHFAKQINRLQLNKQNKKWERFIMGEIKGKTVGFIGYGDIAKDIANACNALGMRCVALRRDGRKKCDLLEKVFGYSGGKEDLEVYRQSDFVVCTLPATAETKQCISYSQFNAMKKNAVFISIGRGSVVDEEALLHALHSGQIAGAALDVFNKEPLPVDSPLWSSPNLLLSSHNADFCDNFNAAATLRVFNANMIKYLRGASSNADMETPVDCNRGY